MKKTAFILLSFVVLATQCTYKKKSRQSLYRCNAHFPEWVKDAAIYEVNIRQYTSEGTFNAFANHLPRLKELGVKILWLMPVHPIGERNRKGSLGSPYSVKDYKKVNPEFGTFEDFMNLVNQCHEMDFKVILDWVANHTAWDHQWVTDHPEWYKKDSAGNLISPFDWTDVVQLDYDNTELRKEMIEALKFWIEKTDIDGYRCDVAGMVPVDFWDEARMELDKIKPVFMLAEDEAEKELLLNAFNMNYGWEMHHIMNSIAKGEKDATHLWDYFNKADSTYPAGAIAMHFTSNHDENAWNGTAFERMEDAVEAFTVISATVPGMMLVYNGQEAGLDKRLAFFEKDTIRWQEHRLFDLYRDLINLKKEHKALWSGPWEGNFTKIKTDKPKKVFSFSRRMDRDSIMVFINVTSDTVDCTIQGPINFNGYEYFSGRKVEINKERNMKFAPWDYKIVTLGI